MSGRLAAAERERIRVEIHTNAQPREPETRYILALLDHAAAVEKELEEARAIIDGQVAQLAHLTEQRTTLRRANAALTEELVGQRGQVAVKADAITAEG